MKTIKVKGCKDCPFISEPEEDYEDDCTHPDFIISPLIIDRNKIPDWCPLKKEPIKIELDNENRS